MSIVLSMVKGSYSEFIPADNYFIACGSLRNVSFQGQVYIPDSQQSSYVIESEENSVMASSSNSNSFVLAPIYQSARIFPVTTSNIFDI